MQKRPAREGVLPGDADSTPMAGVGHGGAPGQETNPVRPQGPIPALHICPRELP